MYVYLISVSILILSFCQLNSKTIIEIDNTKRYQVIDGWEAVVNGMEATNIREKLVPHLSGLIDIAVNDVGITRLRLGMSSNLENTIDNFQLILDGELSFDDYKKVNYVKVNDNNDPYNADPAGFKFTSVDFSMENLILPFREAVIKNKERFYLNLCFVDFKDQSEFHHSDDPEEYAEYMSYSWKYIDEKYNIIPDGLEVILEPDNADKWSAKKLPPVLAAVGDRLSGMGYNPDYIAPSLKSVYGIPNYFDAIAKNSKALSYLDVISYHLYAGRGDVEALSEIVDRAEKYNLKTSMLEYDKAGNVNYLHYDLKHNNNVAWTKYALIYPTNEQWSYVYIENNDLDSPKYGVCTQTKYLRQYFKFIRPGAQRIDAIGGSDEVDPIAFENDNGSQVVVIKSTRETYLVINGLKAGEYGIKYTLGRFEWNSVEPTHYDVDLEDIVIADGESVEFTLPAQGVVTIYSKSNTISNIDLDIDNIIISPNPASDVLKIDNIKNLSRVELIDLKGKVLLSKNAVDSLEFDISSFTKGTYFIRIKQHNTNETVLKNIIIK